MDSNMFFIIKHLQQKREKFYNNHQVYYKLLYLGQLKNNQK